MLTMEQAKQLLANKFCACELVEGVENLYIGNFVQDDNGLAESVLDEIKQLDGLKTLTISSNWYELFSEADLDCELIVIDDLVNIFR